MNKTFLLLLVSLSIISSEISFMVFLELLLYSDIPNGIPTLSLAASIKPFVSLSVVSDLLFQVSPNISLKASKKGSNDMAASS